MGRKGPPPQPIEPRFRAKIIIAPSGCHIWIGARNTRTVRGRKIKSYGMLTVSGQRRIYAHRWAYERWVGPIPKGSQVDHLCRVLRCVNPKHLQAVTRWMNMDRGMLGAVWRRSACDYGHRWPKHLYIRPNNGYRMCRRCFELRNRGIQPQKISGAPLRPP